MYRNLAQYMTIFARGNTDKEFYFPFYFLTLYQSGQSARETKNKQHYG